MNKQKELLCITIIDKQSGDSVKITEEYDDPTDWPPFLWTEGNMACDCNRADAFFQAKGIEETTIPCGHDRYGVIIEHNGRVYTD